MSKGKKMYANSPKLERDAESGKVAIKRKETAPEKKSEEVAAGTSDEGVHEVHQKHEKERFDLHQKHEKELLAMAQKHRKETHGESKKEEMPAAESKEKKD